MTKTKAEVHLTVTDVQSLYERRPYPHYPLLAKPLWQDGYLGFSRFAALLASTEHAQQNRDSFLSIGCGEILPYVLRKWEPNSTTVSCVDLSRRSLSRARFRCALIPGKIQFVHADINQLWATPQWQKRMFHHMEAFGVIHHISKTQETLNHMANHLHPGGTIRLMVYNARARDWIWNINRSFRLLGLRYEKDQDVELGRSILRSLALHSKRLRDRLHQMGASSLKNDSWFADTFMHPWESRLDIPGWFQKFDSANLKAFALFDRYAELDDLPNPLWVLPNIQQLSERALDLRFENNLEIWLTHSHTVACSEHALSKNPTTSAESIPLRLRTRLPPSLWCRFPETKSLTLSMQWTLWQGWIKSLHGHTCKKALRLIESLPLATNQRLARIGAITKRQALELSMTKELTKPLCKHMDAPELAAPWKDDDQMIGVLKGGLPEIPHEKIVAAVRRLYRAL